MICDGANNKQIKRKRLIATDMHPPNTLNTLTTQKRKQELVTTNMDPCNRGCLQKKSPNKHSPPHLNSNTNHPLMSLPSANRYDTKFESKKPQLNPTQSHHHHLNWNTTTTNHHYHHKTSPQQKIDLINFETLAMPQL